MRRERPVVYRRRRPDRRSAGNDSPAQPLRHRRRLRGRPGRARRVVRHPARRGARAGRRERRRQEHADPGDDRRGARRHRHGGDRRPADRAARSDPDAGPGRGPDLPAAGAPARPLGGREPRLRPRARPGLPPHRLARPPRPRHRAARPGRRRARPGSPGRHAADGRAAAGRDRPRPRHRAPRCCCSTSRPRRSPTSRRRGCSRWSAPCAPTASAASTSRTGSRKSWRSPIACRCCATAG